jgi:cytochrome c2
MKTNFIITAVLLVVFSGFNEQIKSRKSYNRVTLNTASENAEGLKLFKKNCYACHSVSTKSHDDIIAPPMIAVKKRYLMEFDTKDAFVKAIVAYASNPKTESALMTGAVNKFKVMPKQAFKREDLKKIATYIYENKIETPVWFEDHFRKNHKNG